MAAELDPRRLLTFLEVARSGSFSQAAERLGLTQSAVSQQVAALERQAGVPLLLRTPRGAVPTEAGALVREHGGAVREALALAGRQLADAARGHEALLRVGAFPSALATIVPRALQAVAAADLQIEVRETTGSGTPGQVRDGTLDVALLFDDAAGPPFADARLRREELFTEPFVAMVSTSHPRAGARRVRLATLADEVWTAPSTDGLIARTCRAAGFEPRIAYLTRDPLAIRALVAAGLAVTLTSKRLAHELEGVQPVRVDGDAPERNTYALLPRTGAKRSALEFVRAARAA